MGVILVCVQFLIPFLILVYCYGRILWTLTRRISTYSHHVQAHTKDTFNLARTNTIKTFVLVAICFVICWSNNQVYFLMYTFSYPVNFAGIYYRFTVLMVFLNSTINPFNYLIKYQDYQRAVKSCLTFKKKSHAYQYAERSNVTISAISNDTHM